jgi:hypothetical protein
MIFNHLRIEVLVHETYEGHMRVVGFEVEPFSLADRTSPKVDHSQKHKYLVKDEPINFSYSIKTTKKTEMFWSTRYDHYVKLGNNEIHLM